MAGVAAGLAAVAVGVVVLVDPFGLRHAGPPVSARHEAAPTSDLSVFLCVQSSATSKCDKTEASPEQKRLILERLKQFPGLRRVVYESTEQALAKFKREFAGQEIANGAQEGDIPDSYRVWLSNPADAPKLAAAVENLPGVDQAIVEKKRLDISKLKDRSLPMQKADITVFLCVPGSVNSACPPMGATTEQHTAILNRLRGQPGVVKVEYESQDQAWTKFQRTFADQPRVTEGMGPDDLPDSYRVTLAPWADVATLKNIMGAVPGVDQVVTKSGQ